MGPEAAKPCAAAGGAAAVAVGADFLLYGPVEDAPFIFPAVAMIDTAPPDLRGSVFGVLHFVSRISTLVASLLAGAVWKWYGPRLTFINSAVFSVVALASLLCWRERYHDREPDTPQGQ